MTLGDDVSTSRGPSEARPPRRLPLSFSILLLLFGVDAGIILNNWFLCPRFRLRSGCVPLCPIAFASCRSLWPRFRLRSGCVPLCPVVSRRVPSCPVAFASCWSLWPRFRLRSGCVPLCPVAFASCRSLWPRFRLRPGCVPLCPGASFLYPYQVSFQLPGAEGAERSEAPKAPFFILFNFHFFVWGRRRYTFDKNECKPPDTVRSEDATGFLYTVHPHQRKILIKCLKTLLLLVSPLFIFVILLSFSMFLLGFALQKMNASRKILPDRKLGMFQHISPAET